MLLLLTLIAFTILVLLCYFVRVQGKFNQALNKQVHEALSLLIILELNQNRPVQGCREFKISGRDLAGMLKKDNDIPPRI